MSVKRRTPDGHALAELARRQHGIVSRRQLLELGHARATISGWEKDGKLHRLHRGVYAVGHEALSWEGRLLAAVLANEPAVASHKTAAWIWGLLRTRPGTFHLTAPTRRHRKELVVVHFARLEPEDVRTVDRIPVTSPARTVLDLAPDESARDLGRLLKRADDNELLDRRRFEALVSRAGGHPGRGKFAAALRASDPEQDMLASHSEKRIWTPARYLKIRPAALGQSRGIFRGWRVGGGPPRRAGDSVAEHRGGGRSDRTRGRNVWSLPACSGEPRETIERVVAHLARRRATIRPRRSVA